MRVLEDIVRELVEMWVAKAEMDYRAAQRLGAGAEPLREPLAFHCQQAAEKYLKAVLVRHQVEFPKTHRLRLLLDLMAPVAPGLAASLEGVDVLTPYGVDIRYPSDFPTVLPGEEIELFALATRARDAVMAELRSFLSTS